MSKQDETPQVIPDEFNYPALVSPPINTALTPVKLAEILQKMGLSGPKIETAALVDHTFTITGGKSFPSSFQAGEHAYFVVARDEATGEVFTTTLGGMAVITILDALVAAGFDRPLTVTLRWNTGGKYSGYYTIE